MATCAVSVRPASSSPATRRHPDPVQISPVATTPLPTEGNAEFLHEQMDEESSTSSRPAISAWERTGGRLAQSDRSWIEEKPQRQVLERERTRNNARDSSDRRRLRATVAKTRDEPIVGWLNGGVSDEPSVFSYFSLIGRHPTHCTSLRAEVAAARWGSEESDWSGSSAGGKPSPGTGRTRARRRNPGEEVDFEGLGYAKVDRRRETYRQGHDMIRWVTMRSSSCVAEADLPMVCPVTTLVATLSSGTRAGGRLRPSEQKYTPGRGSRAHRR